MKYRTYEDWDRIGFYVKYGEKSHKKDEDGRRLFSELQVEEKTHTNLEDLYGAMSPSDFY